MAPDVLKNILSLGDLVVQSFYWLIIGGTVLALGILVVSGVKYMTTLKPAEAKDAKKQAVSAILGLCILVSAFVLLNTINPQLIEIIFPNLSPTPKIPIISNPVTPFQAADQLKRLSDMVDEIKKFLNNNVKETASDLKTLTEKCECGKTKSSCSCAGQGQTAACQPQKCYVGPDSNPCGKQADDIKNDQQRIVYAKDILLYYQNRSIEEKKDLEDNVNRVVQLKIDWYQNQIKTASDNYKKARDINSVSDKAFWNHILTNLQKERGDLQEEKQIKQKIINNLDQLKNSLEPLKDPMNNLASLPQQCYSGVASKCQATCKTNASSGSGCYNALLGCQPDVCKGENPCPQDEIKQTAEDIDSKSQQVISILGEISNNVKSLSQ